MNAYKKLLKNSGIFAIANLSSKFLSILLVPFYTYVLSTEQYGKIDIFTTTISLLLPIITLNIFDATLRFSIKSKYDPKSIFTTSMMIIMLGNVVFICLYPVLLRISAINEYINLFYIVIILQSINSTFSQFIRGIGKVKSFAFNGVLSTFIILTFNIILLAKFNMGIKGYFTSMIIASLICNFYLIFSGRLWRYFSIRYVKKNLANNMINYSIPLIPNSLMWWLMNASDRYIIGMFLGISSNGLYAVANKIPTLLNVLNTIFFQAWQLSAIEEGDSKNKSLFYTNVFNTFSTVMLLGVSGILFVLKPILESILAIDYKESWRYVPFLLLSVVFTSFSSFLGTNYIAMKETKGVFKTSLVGGILNIILNLILIPTIGINGASIATMISFAVVWIIRIYDTKKFVLIKLDLKKLIYSLILIFLQIAVLYMEIKFYLIIESVLVILLLLVNKSDLFNIINQIMIVIKTKRVG